MIIWLNGAFGAGKTTCAFELNRRLPNSFVYDPENVGFFIRKNIPRELYKPNFQDHEEWRSFNHTMLTKLYQEFKGTIIVPMTIINSQYYEEIIQQLINDGAVLKHYILYADKETILNRLNKRLRRGDTWAKSQIDQCIYAFNNDITEEKIITDNRSIDSVVDEIAKKSGLHLFPDNRAYLNKLIDRTITLIKHIRL